MSERHYKYNHQIESFLLLDRLRRLNPNDVLYLIDVLVVQLQGVNVLLVESGELHDELLHLLLLVRLFCLHHFNVFKLFLQLYSGLMKGRYLRNDLIEAFSL